MAPRKTMRRQIRKNKSNQDDKKREQYWHNLYKKVLKKAEEHQKGDLIEDLQSFQNRPERILREYSIISEDDIDREFPSD